MGSQRAEKTPAGRFNAAVEPVVVMVTVEVAVPLLVSVTGVVEKLEALHAGKGEPVPLALQVKLTGRSYPNREVSVTVEVPDVPGLTAAGVVAEMLKSATVAEEISATNPSYGLPP
jgi:hypothetical protein